MGGLVGALVVECALDAIALGKEIVSDIEAQLQKLCWD